MPIIINEFEIVTDPQKPKPVSPEATDPAPDIPAMIHPDDVVRVILRQRLRSERLRAD